MKFTLLLTMRCNLSCRYCYIKPVNEDMSLETARKIINFAFKKGENESRLDFGFFGGEPLLRLETLEAIAEMITVHPSFGKHDVRMTLVSNGTLFNERIISFMNKYNIVYQVSFDGLPELQDCNRRFVTNMPTSEIVEKNIRLALQTVPAVLVNVVYTPSTISELVNCVTYLSSMGIRYQFFNPDYSALWSQNDLENLKNVFKQIAEQYVSFHRSGKPHFINIIDEKVALILNGGYKPADKCSMGEGEFAFSPQGWIFPCERLVGNGSESIHAIGHIENPDTLNLKRCKGSSFCSNVECAACGVADYCMNWCGCSNFFATGNYNRVNSFICHSERAAIEAAMGILDDLNMVKPDLLMGHFSDALTAELLSLDLKKDTCF